MRSQISPFHQMYDSMWMDARAAAMSSSRRSKYEPFCRISTRLPASMAPSVRPMSDGTMLSMLPSPESSKFGLMRRRFVVQSSRRRPPTSGTCQSSLLEPPERARRELFRPFNFLLLRRCAADADAHDGVALHDVKRAGQAIAAPDRLVADACDRHGDQAVW